MSPITQQVLKDLAPNGILHAAINFGNAVLAQPGADGEPQVFLLHKPNRWPKSGA